MNEKESHQTALLAARQKISDTIRGVALRTVALNPVYPQCMVSTIDFLDMGEIKLAIEFFFQSILNPQDQLIDISVHDLIYMIHISALEGAGQYSLKNFQSYFEDEVLKLYM